MRAYRYQPGINPGADVPAPHISYTSQQMSVPAGRPLGPDVRAAEPRQEEILFVTRQYLFGERCRRLPII
jgi:hypothetical protein